MSKKFSLIKTMNEQVTEQQKEVADNSQLSEVDSSPNANDIGRKFNSLRELQRIANYWEEHGQGMDEAELRERIAYELEQLEYNPDQIAEALPRIMFMIQRNEEENQELESEEEPDDFDPIAHKNADERYGPIDDEDDESDVSDEDVRYIPGEEPDPRDKDVRYVPGKDPALK